MGDLVFLTGQVGNPNELVGEQTATALAAVDDLLRQAGSDKSSILNATVLLSDIDDFSAMNQVWDNWVDRINPPSRATYQAPLITRDHKVEIIIVAAMKAQ